MWLNRTLCNVLEEMRKAYETRNFSYLPGLIEEAQSMGNRMESAFEDIHDIERLHDDKKELLAETKALKAEKAVLNKELGKEEEKKDIFSE